MEDTNQSPTKSTPAPTRRFGPFLEVPCDAVKPAGWKCHECRNPVERFAQALPGMVPRMIFHACACGCAVVFEDETQPHPRTWRLVIDLLKASKAKVAIFDGGKSLSPDFSGVN